MAHAVAQSQVAKGDLALEKGRAKEAIDAFRRALESEPEMAEAHRGLGMSYAMQGKDAVALREYQQYLELAPTAADAADIRRAIEELRSRSRLGGGEEP